MKYNTVAPVALYYFITIIVEVHSSSGLKIDFNYIFWNFILLLSQTKLEKWCGAIDLNTVRTGVPAPALTQLLQNNYYL